MPHKDRSSGFFRVPDITPDLALPAVPLLSVPEENYFPGVGRATPEIVEVANLEWRGELAVFEVGLLELGIELTGPLQATLFSLDSVNGIEIRKKDSRPIGGVRCGRFDGVDGGWVFVGPSSSCKDSGATTSRGGFVLDHVKPQPVVGTPTGFGDTDYDLFVLVDSSLAICGLTVDTTGSALQGAWSKRPSGVSTVRDMALACQRLADEGYADAPVVFGEEGFLRWAAAELTPDGPFALIESWHESVVPDSPEQWLKNQWLDGPEK